MTHFSSWEEIAPTATKAELKLKQEVKGEKLCNLGSFDLLLPEPGDWSQIPTHRKIRAEVLHFILTNPKKAEVSPTGILLSGAYISGDLDLSYVKGLPNIYFSGCRFEKEVTATKTSWSEDLQLIHCVIPSFQASGIEVSGQINLEGSFFGYHAQTLQRNSKTPTESGRKSTLDLQDARIGNSLLLPSAAVFGGLRVASAKISGQLNCEEATLTTSLPFYKEERSRSDQAHPNYALDLQEIEVGRSFLFRYVVTCEDAVNFVRASVDGFDDTGTTWKVHEDTSFDGFTYNHLHGKLDHVEHLNWLSVGDTFEDQFYPQPALLHKSVEGFIL